MARRDLGVVKERMTMVNLGDDILSGTLAFGDAVVALLWRSGSLAG
jgi:hypothetical protein